MTMNRPILAALLALVPFCASADTATPHLYLAACPGFEPSSRVAGEISASAAVKPVRTDAYRIGHEDACSTLEFASADASIAELPGTVEPGFSVSVAARGAGRVLVKIEADERDTVVIPSGLVCMISALPSGYHLSNCRPLAAGGR